MIPGYWPQGRARYSDAARRGQARAWPGWAWRRRAAGMLRVARSRQAAREANSVTSVKVSTFHRMNRPTRPGSRPRIRFHARPLLALTRPDVGEKHNGVVLKISIVSRSQRVRERFHRIFAEKEVFFRSHGKVRFVRIGSRVQILAAAVLGATLAGWLIGAAIMLYNQFSIAHDRAAIDARAATVADQARKVDAFSRSVRDIGEDIDRRQDLLDDMVRSQFGVSGDDPAVVGAPDAATAQENAGTTGKKLSAAMPDASTLRAAEQRQTRFAQRLATLVNQRAAKAESAIRRDRKSVV